VAKIAELQQGIDAIDKTIQRLGSAKKNTAAQDMIKVLKAERACLVDYIEAIRNYTPNLPHVANGAVITFRFDEYEGTVPCYQVWGRRVMEKIANIPVEVVQGRINPIERAVDRLERISGSVGFSKKGTKKPNSSHEDAAPTRTRAAKRGLAKELGGIPRSAQPVRQGRYGQGTKWWEYEDHHGNRKIVVEHPDGSVHVGTPKRQSTHLEGGPPKYYPVPGTGHVGDD